MNANPTILIMIDGLGADYFEKYRHRLPHLGSLATRGTLVERLSPERCAISSPGRASIITGVPSSAHGIYGNYIWDSEQARFRYANSTDVQAVTVAQQASEANLRVANMGFGMLGPEHCALYHPAIWSYEMVENKLSKKVSKADQVWVDQMALASNAPWLNTLNQQGYAEALASRDYDESLEYLLSGQLNDQIMLDWCAGIACQPQSNKKDLQADLIITEIAMPDYFLHRYGCEHDLTRLAIEMADAQVGRFISALTKADKLSSTNIIVTSDHGFSPVEQSLHPEHIFSEHALEDMQFDCEGGILHVHHNDSAQLQQINKALTAYDCEHLDNSYLPLADREHIACFLAPEHCDFYLDKHQHGQAIGPAYYHANHGFKQGHPADERFLVMAGPDIEHKKVSFAKAEQVAPTIANLLGLSTEIYPETSFL